MKEQTKCKNLITPNFTNRKASFFGG